PPTGAQDNTGEEDTPVAKFAGDDKLATAGEGDNTFNVKVFVLVTVLAVPVAKTVYVPTIADVMPVTVIDTAVLFVLALGGLKIAVAPAGNPEAENVVVSLNAKNVL